MIEIRGIPDSAREWKHTFARIYLGSVTAVLIGGAILSWWNFYHFGVNAGSVGIGLFGGVVLCFFVYLFVSAYRTYKGLDVSVVRVDQKGFELLMEQGASRRLDWSDPRIWYRVEILHTPTASGYEANLTFAHDVGCRLAGQDARLLVDLGRKNSLRVAEKKGWVTDAGSSVVFEIRR